MDSICRQETFPLLFLQRKFHLLAKLKNSLPITGNGSSQVFFCQYLLHGLQTGSNVQMTPKNNNSVFIKFLDKIFISTILITT